MGYNLKNDRNGKSMSKIEEWPGLRSLVLKHEILGRFKVGPKILKKNSKFCFSRNLNLKVLKSYFVNSCYCKLSLKLVFSKRVIFAFEKTYFEKILSN